MTKYSKSIPKIYLECKKHFGVSWDKGIIITYGDTVYSKFLPLSDDLKIHEDVHVRQQTAMGPDVWWNKYLTDAFFRLDQEMEAYKAQLIWIKNNCKEEYYANAVNNIAKNLSSLYGKMCTYDEAKIMLYELTRPTKTTEKEGSQN